MSKSTGMATLDPSPQFTDLRQETKVIISNDESGAVCGIVTHQSETLVLEHDANKENVEGSAETVENGAVPKDETPHENNDGADDSPVIDININNVVCTFNVRCHINLKRVAMEGSNVEYRREHGILNMKLRQPRVTANITSSGKVTVTGSTSEDQAKMAARRVARVLQKLGFNVRFRNYRVVNVLGTCSLPFGIKLSNFSNHYPQEASYEPELHPGVTFKIKDIKATLKIFSTGSITITAPCVNNIGLAVEHIYPLVSEFQMEKRAAPAQKAKRQKLQAATHRPYNGYYGDDSDDFDDEDDEEGQFLDSMDEESFDSDVSHD